MKIRVSKYTHIENADAREVFQTDANAMYADGYVLLSFQIGPRGEIYAVYQSR